MAVRAAHNALRDLSLDSLPARAVGDHCRDVESLVAKVVELQNDNVLLTAVNAGTVLGRAKQVGYAGKQVIRVKRLPQVSLRLSEQDPIVIRGHHEHWRGAMFSYRPETAQELISVHYRHCEIEQDQVGLASELRKRVKAVHRRLNSITHVAEDGAVSAADSCIVFDQQDARADAIHRVTCPPYSCRSTSLLLSAKCWENHELPAGASERSLVDSWRIDG